MRYVISFLLLLLSFTTTAPAQEEPDIRRTVIPRTPIANGPGGARIGFLYIGAPVQIEEKRGEWVKVNVSAWIKDSAVSLKEITAEEADAALEQPIVIEDYTLSRKPGKHAAAKVILKLSIKNVTDEMIFAWKAVLVGKNSKGEEVLRENVVSERIELATHELSHISLVWKSNDSNYKKMMELSQDKAQFSLEEIDLK